ncbi:MULTISPECIES: hypothetical protein [unclassified Streptomyces]|uniref:hypothetical protein n=1 Tax=Streptomyces sp. NPDC055082 TaxID=3365718 RepID=UPI0037D3F158
MPGELPGNCWPFGFVSGAPPLAATSCRTEDRWPSPCSTPRPTVGGATDEEEKAVRAMVASGD